LASDAEYDVYNTPRIGAVQFGDFVAADGSEREGLLRGAKFVRRTHRARAYFARGQIGKFLLQPVHNLGLIDTAIDSANADSTNPKFTEQKQADAHASLDALRGFLALTNVMEIGSKDLIPADDKLQSIEVGGTAVSMELTCLIKSFDKNKNERIGAIFLNSQKGRGLGKKSETQAKRRKAGETVSLLVLQRLMDEYSDYGEPYYQDALHLYLRAKHIWQAPKYYTQRLSNIEAEGRAIAALWEGVSPPSDFNPDKATFKS